MKLLVSKSNFFYIRTNDNLFNIKGFKFTNIEKIEATGYLSEVTEPIDLILYSGIIEEGLNNIKKQGYEII